ncbi:MAG TPA: DNA-3-methyladenine glycosylase [Patescibacteria group bacterium]
MILPPDFYALPTELVAQELLGKLLVHESPEGITVGRIIETEAYVSNDPANHAYRGQTQRNAPMFGPAGRSYIYLIYGMHYCFNIVTAPQGVGEAVLIRALEPLEGIPLMQLRRNKVNLSELTSGPAKLVQAMGVTLSQNNKDVTSPPLYVADQYRSHCALEKNSFSFIAGPRVGIRVGTDLNLRYLIVPEGRSPLA